MRSLPFFLACTLLGGCAEDPEEDPWDPADGDRIVGAPCDPAPAYTEEVSGCSPAADDYQPRAGDDTWPACISDDNAYHQLGASVSSIARVAAYTDIGAALWVDDPRPTRQEFLDLRVLFEEEQGLGSRVARRYDVHYAPPAAGGCEDEGVPEENPDYCVGPATLQPIITAAFADGALGHERVQNAARLHAALQWFLYVSAIKEATTCATTPADCDSSWAYYAGGGTRQAPLGLAAEIQALAPETHQRAFDAILAVRCWRNLDHETGEAQDLALRDRAIVQLDRALQRGMTVLVRQRFAALECTTDHYQEAALEELRILVPLFDRAVRERDEAAADFLLAAVARTATAIDVAGATSRLDAIFPCY